MQFTKFALLLVAALAFCCRTSEGLLEGGSGVVSVVGGLLATLLGLVGQLLGQGLLFQPTDFFMQGDQIMASGVCSLPDLDGNSSGSCALPVQGITTSDVGGRCQLVNVLLGATNANILGIVADLPEGLILNVTGQTSYLLGNLLCKLVGSGSGGLLENLDGSQLSLITNLLQNLV